MLKFSKQNNNWNLLQRYKRDKRLSDLIQFRQWREKQYRNAVFLTSIDLSYRLLVESVLKELHYMASLNIQWACFVPKAIYTRTKKSRDRYI
jgi:hypothetical protein